MLVQSRARLKFVSIPPRKMRLVANMVKGMSVQRALDVLNFTPRIAARHIAKTVSSAAANALSKEGTDRLKPEDLVVKNIMVDAAPTAKRIRFQSMGRVFRYRKRFCHLTIFLEGRMEDEEPKKTRGSKKETTKKTVKAKTKAATDDKKTTEQKPDTKAKTEAQKATDDAE